MSFTEVTDFSFKRKTAQAEACAVSKLSRKRKAVFSEAYRSLSVGSRPSLLSRFETLVLPHLLNADASQMNALSKASFIHSLRGLGRLADPLESSERFSKYLERSLIVECKKK